MTSATVQAREAARSPWVERLGIFGWLAKGVLYLVMAILALQVALGVRGGETADQQGALQEVADQPFGSVLLGLLAAGLAGYGLWRLLDAALARSHDASDGVERVGHALSGLIHLGLAVVAVRLLVGQAGKNGNDQASTLTAKLLDLPAGRWLVGLLGVVVAGVGLYFVKEGLDRSFLQELDLSGAGSGERTLVERTGLVGNVARGVVFAVLGWFLVRAAVQYDPAEAKGLDGALRTLADRPYGPFLLGAVAVGLAIYGAFAMLSARHRRPPGS
jgi:Domain of Unknown Function (DUF1206)